MTPATAELRALGATVQLSAEVRDQNGQAMAGAPVNWASNTAAVATVDATGLVAAVANGSATITATSGSASGSATVTVMQSADSVAVQPAEATFAALGDTVRLSAEAFDANGSTVAGAEFSWESGDEAVATVGASGLVTAVANGSVTITVTSGSASGSATVTVMQSADSVAVQPAEATFAALGDTVRLSAEAFDANGSTVAGAEFSWESSDGTVATVDAGGLVTAVTNGSATITATSGSALGSAAVTVMQSADSVAVQPAEVSFAALGDTVRLSAQAFDANGSTVAAAEFSWESIDEAVVTVDASGLVTAVANGSATITATSGSASASAAVTVAQSPDSVALSPTEASLAALGDTVRLAAEVFDANGHAVAAAELLWASSDGGVATVDGSGLVLAAGNGTAAITATAGSVAGSATVTVAQEVTEVSVSPDKAELTALGATVQLTAEARDLNGHVVAEAEFVWAASNTSVATVNGSGLVTAVGTGTAQVTATSAGAAGTAVLQVVLSYTLSGTVTDGRRAGLAVPGATVRLVSGTTQSRTTDARGRYRFPNVSGQVKITVSAPGYRDQTAEVVVGSDSTLDFTLQHSGKPPFSGTVWVTPDVLGPSDPTSLGRVTYAGRGMREIYDRRVSAWITVNAYLFNVQFGERTVEFQFNPEFGSRAAARAEVDVFAPAIGRLPTALMSNLQEVEVNAGEGSFGGNFYNGSFLIHTEDPSTKYAVRKGFLEEIFLHEGAHVSLDREHSGSPGWRAAQRADGVSISDYARDYPDREDVAESILPYFAVRYQPQRLTASVRWLMMMTIPNRLAYLDEQELDMSPYTPQPSIVVAAPTTSTLSALRDRRRFEDPPIPPRLNRR